MTNLQIYLDNLFFYSLTILTILITSYRIRAEFQESLEQLVEMGYNVAATPGTAEYYNQQLTEDGKSHKFHLTTLLKPGDVAAAAASSNGSTSDANDDMAVVSSSSSSLSTDSVVTGSDRSVIKWIESKTIDLVINIPEGTTRRDEVSSGYLIRRAAVDYGVGLLTNIK